MTSKEPKAKKPIFKRWWFWLIVILVIAGAASGVEDDTATPTNGNSSTISNVDMSQPETPSEPAASQEPANNDPATGQDTVSGESVATQESDSDNPLINAKLVEIPVMNGFKTERIGTAAYIISDKSLVTESGLAEFAAQKVDGNIGVSIRDGGI